MIFNGFFRFFILSQITDWKTCYFKSCRLELLIRSRFKNRKLDRYFAYICAISIVFWSRLLEKFDDMMLGVSRPRNMNLSSAFIKLNLAEGWGFGIGNIRKLYKNNALPLQFLISSHAVKVVLRKLLGEETNCKSSWDCLNQELSVF